MKDHVSRESFFVSHGQIRIQVHTDGDANAPPLVLLPSLCADHSMWKNNITDLVKSYFVIRINLRGQGSSKAPHAGNWTMSDLCEDVLQTLDFLKINTASICGCSLGGLVAQSFALAYPDRVERLVLIGTAAHFPPRKLWQDRILRVRNEGVESLFDAAIQRWIVPNTRVNMPSLVNRLQRSFVTTKSDEFCGLAAILRDTDLRPALNELKHETLIIVGDKDTGTPPSCAWEMHKLLPHSKCHVLEDAAHLANLDKPQEFAQRLIHFVNHPV